MRRFLLALLLAVASPPGFALDPARSVDEYTVTAWTMEDGLPHNFVQYISQDSEGFLWVGTWEGAARFDGRGFDAYNRRTLKDIAFDGVRTLLPMDDGSMLLGTTQFGVMRYERGQWSMLEDTFQQRLRVMSMLRAGDGGLWIGCEDALYRRDKDGNRLIRIGTREGLPDGAVLSLLELPGDEGVLVGTLYGLYLWRGGGQAEPIGERLGLGVRGVRALLKRSDGSLVVGSQEGAWSIDPGLTTAKRFLREQVEAVLEDRDGALWLMTSNGLVRDLAGKQERIDAAVGLKGHGGKGLFEDRQGLLWVGTTNGLYRVSDGAVFGLDSARGLSDNYARAILRMPDGAMLIGHARGLDLWRAGEVEPLGQGGSATSVLALAPARDGGVYAGTYDRGVLHYPPGLDPAGIEVIDVANGLRSNHVRAVAEAADGTLYVGTSNGLAILRDGRVVETLGEAQGLPGDFVRALLLGADGGLWIGTSNGLAYRGADGALQVWASGLDFPGVSAFDMYVDPEARLWIGSDAGLLRLRGDGSFAVYDHRVGLPNDSIFRVLDDGQGHFWLSSNQGAFRIARSQFRELDAGRRSRLSIDAFDKFDGMPSSQCNGGNAQAGDFDAQGRVWLPTATGVAVIDPAASAEQSRGAVPVRIEQVWIDGQRQPPVEPYVLESGARRLSIRYAGMDFRAPLRIRYRYRMEGFDDDWIEAGSAMEAIYTNLPGGRLRFEVQATMNGDWSDPAVAESSATVALDVVPPYWQRPWFIAVAIAALALLVAMIVQLRANSFRRRQENLSRTIDERTRELSDKNAALEQAWREREALLRQLRHQASHDALTGLLNRGAGSERLAAEMGVASSGSPLCVALVDIDHFKRVNDDYGHNVGDLLLRHVALSLAAQEANAGGIVSRHGGEEFLVVMPGTSLPEAARRLGDAVAYISRTPLEHPELGPLRVTISVGVAEWHPGVSASRLIATADRRLYRAKHEGRNRMVAAD